MNNIYDILICFIILYIKQNKLFVVISNEIYFYIHI